MNKILFFIFITLPFSAYASPITEELYNQCRGLPGKEVGVIYCFGYIQATINILGNSCPPDTLTTTQPVLIFEKWVENNPEKINQPAVTSIIESWNSAFPCPKK